MSERMETEALLALKEAAGAATGDPARYPRRGAIDRYHSAVVAAYEAGDLVPATEVLEWRELSAQLVNTIADSDLPLAQRKAVIATIRAMKQPVSEVSHG